MAKNTKITAAQIENLEAAASTATDLDNLAAAVSIFALPAVKAPKAAKAPTAVRTPKDPNLLGKPFAAVLQCLADGPKEGLTRGQISEATGITSGFTSLLGHQDPAKREPQSLSARGFIEPKLAKDESGKVNWVITTAGKAALKAHVKALAAAAK